MARIDHTQFNIRSAFARKRARELAELTGMTTAQIVEDALRGYVPLVKAAKVGRLVQRGPILVHPAASAEVSLVEANMALEAARDGDD